MAALRPSARRYWMRFAAAMMVLYASVCVLAWIASDSMMFFPGYGSRDEPSNATQLTLENGAQVSAVFLPNPGADFTLWYFHGNAEALADIDSRLQELQALGFQFLLWNIQDTGQATASPRRRRSMPLFQQVSPIFALSGRFLLKNSSFTAAPLAVDPP